jgi:chorismate mutase
MLLRPLILLLALACAPLPAAALQCRADSVTNTIKLEPLRHLMDERMAMMPDVARHKWNTQGAIDDLPREQNVVASLSAQAQQLGIPGPWAERFFRAQIEGAKQTQRAYFVQWQQAGEGKFAQVPDLVTVIRPYLDALTPHLLRELAAAWPALADPCQRERIVAAMATLEQGTAQAKATVTAPLTDGSAHPRAD